MTQQNSSRDDRDHRAPPATMSIEEAAKLLGIGRSSCYRAAHAGLIPVIIIGRRVLVVTAKLYDMLGLGGEGDAETASLAPTAADSRASGPSGLPPTGQSAFRAQAGSAGG